MTPISLNVCPHVLKQSCCYCSFDSLGAAARLSRDAAKCQGAGVAGLASDSRSSSPQRCVVAGHNILNALCVAGQRAPVRFVGERIHLLALATHKSLTSFSLLFSLSTFWRVIWVVRLLSITILALRSSHLKTHKFEQKCLFAEKLGLIIVGFALPDIEVAADHRA